MINAEILNLVRKDCTGCSSCFNICPQSAITMSEDEEGFSYPNIDEENCIKCSLCNSVCPAQKNKREEVGNSLCYAAWAKDVKIRLESSSGGIFPLLAEKVIEDGGYVAGAVFEGETLSVSHKLISQKSQIPDLSGSKYIQSSIGTTYSEIKQLLEKKITVLFSGTPCQIAGLRSFLKREYDTLLTIDILCHGVPSPLVFRKFITEQLGIHAEVRSINFKEKKNGWKSPNLCINYRIGNIDYVFEEPTYKNLYIQGFLNDLYNRPCCGHCSYATPPRPADLSLGDFWKINDFSPKLDDNKGTSLVLINTDKGKAFLDLIYDKLDQQQVPIEYALRGNSTLISPNKAHNLREVFFYEINNKKIDNNISDKLQKSGTVGLLNFHVSHKNYGALMVAYALSRKVKELGYTPLNINFIRPTVTEIQDIEPFASFRKKYIPMTKKCYSYQDLLLQNEVFKKIIVGSDQIWLQGWHNNFKFFLNWASGMKTLVAYAASFGTDKFTGKKSEIIAIRGLLRRFDAISVREKSGIDICEDTFFTRAEQVLDPTLLFNMEDYYEIIDNSPTTNEFDGDYIGFMFVNESNTEKLTMSHFGSQNHLINSLKDEKGNYRPFGHWLKCIQNAKYMITDSFHGTCFSLIFKKQFILMNNSYSGNERISDLLISLNIKADRFYNKFEDIAMESFFNEIDYDDAYTYLTKLRERSTSYLERSLLYKPIYKEKFNFSLKYYLAKVLEKFKLI